MYCIEVIDGGCNLQLFVKWSPEMTDVCKLHTLWLVPQKKKKINEHHPKIGGFAKALRTMRSEYTNNVYSICNILLPFAMETFIKFELLHWSTSGTTVLHLDLKSAFNRYSDNAHRKKFIPFEWCVSGPPQSDINTSIVDSTITSLHRHCSTQLVWGQ